MAACPSVRCCFALTVVLLSGLLAIPAPAQDDPPSHCRPATLDTWRARCVTRRDDLRDALSAARATRTFADLERAGDACRVLAGSGGDCEGARAQFLALLLGVGSGRLDRDCCVQAGSSGVVRVRRLIERADELLSGSPTADTCADLARSLARINDGSALVSCDRLDDGDDGRDDGDDGRDDRRSHVHGDDTHQGPGAERGRGHEEHGQGRGLGHLKHHGDDDHVASDGDDGPCCDPRTSASWVRACENRERIADSAACEELASTGTGDCARARREVAALRLNVRSGRVAGSCELVGERTAAQALDRAEALLRERDCAQAAELAGSVNSGARLEERRRCDGDGRVETREDRRDGDDGDDDSPGRGKGKSKGKGKDK